MMSLLILVLALVMLVQLQAVSLKSISGGAKWTGSVGSSAARPAPIKNTAVPFKTSSVAPTVASKKSSAGKKDMTWGGRPDPTPEAYVDPNQGFLSAPWRFGRK